MLTTRQVIVCVAALATCLVCAIRGECVPSLSRIIEFATVVVLLVVRGTSAPEKEKGTS